MRCGPIWNYFIFPWISLQLLLFVGQVIVFSSVTKRTCVASRSQTTRTDTGFNLSCVPQLGPGCSRLFFLSLMPHSSILPDFLPCGLEDSGSDRKKIDPHKEARKLDSWNKSFYTYTNTHTYSTFYWFCFSDWTLTYILPWIYFLNSLIISAKSYRIFPFKDWSLIHFILIFVYV